MSAIGQLKTRIQINLQQMIPAGVYVGWEDLIFRDRSLLSLTVSVVYK